MTCVCGGKTRIIDVRHDNNEGITYRRRKCVQCGDVFYTAEQYQFDSDELMKKWRSLNRHLLRKANYEN